MVRLLNNFMDLYFRKYNSSVDGQKDAKLKSDYSKGMPPIFLLLLLFQGKSYG